MGPNDSLVYEIDGCILLTCKARLNYRQYRVWHYLNIIENGAVSYGVNTVNCAFKTFKSTFLKMFVQLVFDVEQIYYSTILYPVKFGKESACAATKIVMKHPVAF